MRQQSLREHRMCLSRQVHTIRLTVAARHFGKSHHDEASELRRQIAALEHRVALLELFVESEHREKMGWTLHDVRAAWREGRAR